MLLFLFLISFEFVVKEVLGGSQQCATVMRNLAGFSLVCINSNKLINLCDSRKHVTMLVDTEI